MADDTQKIQFVVQPCWLGQVLIAATEKGICAIALDNSTENLIVDLKNNLKNNFPKTSLVLGNSEFESSMRPVLDFVENPQLIVPFELDIQGTDFQREVWTSLLAITPGETVTYIELTQRMGKSKSSVRAVANACGKNLIAIAIPCHRVIGSDGSLRGYRWGKERKRRLLEKENPLGQFSEQQLSLLNF